jgi:predicted Zn-dependent protease with MMP-like domain
MRPDQRDYFDSQLDLVLQDLPEQVHRLLEEVPLVVDDFPLPALRRRMGVRRRDDLCGLYTGVPQIRRSIEDSGVPTDVIQLFREGIWRLAVETAGGVFDVDELRRQIRLTILHEVGHHFGLDEEELESLGC